MKKEKSYALFFSCLLLLFTVSGCSSFGQKTTVPTQSNPNIYNETGGNRTAMDNILEKACLGKSIMDNCAVLTTKGKMTSTCSNVNGRVLCRVKSIQRKV